MTTLSHAGRTPLHADRARARLRVRRLPRPELLGLLALAAVLDLWSLSRNGWANDYYAAAVRSMTSSWHNFFFGSFDASGVMTVDKPPLALWVQAASARIFGFHSLSLLVPQALMGVASVALVYDLTRRVFGRPAGFVAGLVLALTPMTVAISRHNNPDALLVLCCVGALWALVRAFEDGRTRWIALAGLLVGLGFETKMGAALLVVPGIAAAWLWFAPAGRMRAFRQLLAGGAVMVVAGLAWPVAVALTPAADRPWISGTSDNSIWSLIFGYNGFGRLDGQMGGPSGAGRGGGPGGNAGPFGGSAGPLRLLNEALGGQAGWLLGFAIVVIAAVALASRMKRSDKRAAWLIAVGGSFVISAVAFSFAKGIFHPYYVSLLSPFMAALIGAGFGLALNDDRTARFFGPLAVIAGALTELAVLGNTPGQLTGLKPLLIATAIFAALLWVHPIAGRARAVALMAALAILLLAPAIWAFDTLGHATSGTFPAGGPASASSFGGPGGGPGGFRGMNGGVPGGPGATRGGFPGGPPALGSGSAPSTGGALPAPPGGGLAGGAPGVGAGAGPFGGDNTSISAAVAYAKAHGGGVVAVSSQSGASGSIIRSGADVVAIGGFSGRESQVSIEWFAREVAAGKIRWVVADSSGGMPSDGRVGSRDVMSAVASTCRSVTTSAGTIYDCRGYAKALGRI